MVRLGVKAVGRAVGHRRKEGCTGGRDAGRSEDHAARDLLEGGNRSRDRDQLGEGEGGRRETGGRLSGFGQGDLDQEAAAVAVVAESLAPKFEDPARSPALELGLLGDLGARGGDEAVGCMLQQPVVGGLLVLLGGLLLGGGRLLGPAVVVISSGLLLDEEACCGCCCSCCCCCCCCCWF